jgi:nitrate reductase NapE component
LASSTEKQEGKARSSLRLFLFFIIGLFIVVAIPSPRVFHIRRR